VLWRELLHKPNLKDSERKRIVELLRVVRVINVDSAIAAAASELVQRYPGQLVLSNDALIAATA
jgi:predicted nucleic acid-binding protein